MSEFPDKLKIKTRPNYLYSILSVALVLFLLGFFGLLIAHGQLLVTSFKEKVVIMLELKDETSEKEVEALRGELAVKPYTKEGSITFTDKAEAAEQMKEAFGEDFLKLDMPNPFYDVMTFNVNAAYANTDSLVNVKGELKDKSIVNEIYYQENLVEDIAENIKKLSWITLGIGLFFIFVAITLIHNTVRLALYANRFLIKNMQLVGATWGFISRPYIYRALKHGLVSSIIAGGLLALMLYWAKISLPLLSELQDWNLFTVLFLGLLVLGVLINTVSTHRVVKKYLKMRIDDLY
jgi:cell division transport system permease protein